MPMYDKQCTQCEWTAIDVLEPINAAQAPCPACGAPTHRAWLTRTPNVIPDDIPGGMEIRHGICHPDGTPRRYYSKSEMRAEAAARGLVNRVEHVPVHGSDKSPHTSRWI